MSDKNKTEKYFEAKAREFNQKLDQMGESVVKPENFSNLMIEGRTLLTFLAISKIKKAPAAHERGTGEVKDDCSADSKRNG